MEDEKCCHIYPVSCQKMMDACLFLMAKHQEGMLWDITAPSRAKLKYIHGMLWGCKAVIFPISLKVFTWFLLMTWCSDHFMWVTKYFVLTSSLSGTSRVMNCGFSRNPTYKKWCRSEKKVLHLSGSLIHWEWLSLTLFRLFSTTWLKKELFECWDAFHPHSSRELERY